MKNRSFSALIASGILLAAATLALTACSRTILYNTPEYNYAGRPIPPSKLLARVLATYTANGSAGGAVMLDGDRDLRGNVQNTIKNFPISGFSEGYPGTILNFPEQLVGYVYSLNDGNLTAINYSKETGSGNVGSFGTNSPSVAAAPIGAVLAGAGEQAGVLTVGLGGSTFNLNLPNVDKVVIDRGGQVILAMVRNSNSLYRVVKLPSTNNPIIPPGSVDCEPLLLPVVCVVPVAGQYDHPVDASFSLDGNTTYILNSGPENGGTAAGVTFLQTGQLNMNLIPTVDPLSAGAPSPLAPIPVANPILVPGGATAALPDSNYLYVAGQQLQTGTYNGLFAGKLTLINLVYVHRRYADLDLRRHAQQDALRRRQHPLDRFLPVCQRRSRRCRRQGTRHNRNHRSGWQLQLPHYGHLRLQRTYGADCSLSGSVDDRRR